MLFLARLWRVSLICVFCLGLALPALAANKILMSIDGAKQGNFKGQGSDKAGDQWTEIIAFDAQAQSPRDASTGQASGKRKHQAVKVTMETGALSPKIQRAMQTNEGLRSVVFEFFRPGPKGQQELYETIHLADALITNIHTSSAANDAKGGRPREEIIIEYEKIQTSRAQGNPSAKDSWQTK